MKISVIHNTYKDNPFIRESVVLNLKALQEVNVDYQYIVFNDNGAEEIEREVAGLDVQYHYSDTNFGHKMCSGGWVGAIPLLDGDLVHNTGQDDVFTPYFYRNVLKRFNDTNCDLVYCNGFVTTETLEMTGAVLLPLHDQDFSDSREIFNRLMGVTNNTITKCDNYIAAPGAVYKTRLHNEIGPPDVENFRGVCDNEYWLRILFNRKRVEYSSVPSWLYRRSEYTAADEIINGEHNGNDIRPRYLEKLKIKYQELIDNE